MYVVRCICVIVFFFKQKTAYELRISDWSSDVCSSDLQAMARLGLDYNAVAKVNPKIVYVGAYGFGNRGPYAGRPAYDDLIQGMTAIPALYQQNSGDVPRYAHLTLADRAVGMHVAIHIQAGVVPARSAGQGQEIEIPRYK